MLPSSALQYGLPFAALDTSQNAVDPELGEAINTSGIWSGLLQIRGTVAKITVQIPTAGQLTYSTVGGIDQYTLDATSFNWMFRDLILGDMGVADPYVPLIGKLTFTGPLDTSTFMPTAAAKRRAKQTGQSVSSAAAGLLHDLKAGTIAGVAMVAGDVLGSVGAASVNMSCTLPDGSSAPLGFVYAYLSSVAPLMLGSGVAAGPWGSNQSLDDTLDAVLPLDGDLFQLLPSGTTTYSVTCSLGASGPGPYVLKPPGSARRFLFPVGDPAPDSGDLSLSTGGAPIPIKLTDPGAAQSTNPTSATVPADGKVHTLSLGPNGPGLVISAPPMTAPPSGSQAGSILVLNPGAAGTNTSAPVTFNGASGGTQVSLAWTSTQSGSGNLGPFSVTNSKWTSGAITLPTNVGAITATFTDDQQATATVTAVPLSIQVDKLRAANPVDTMPVVALTPYPGGRDSLELQAWVQGADQLSTALGPNIAVAWNLTVQTAAITRAQPQNGGDPQVDPGMAAQFLQILNAPAGGSLHNRLCHWIPFNMTADTADQPIPVGQKWDPPPLTVDRSSVSTATANYDVQDAQLLLGPWTGNSSTAAGPVVGTASLAASVLFNNTAIAQIPAYAFQVQGYDFTTVAFNAFYSQLSTTIQLYFGNNYPCQASLNLANGLDDLCRVMLAIYPLESHYLHFDDVNHNAVWTSEVKGNAGNLAYWPNPGPVMVPPAPASVDIPGMPILGPPADAGLGGISSGLTYAVAYAWQLNMDASVSIFRDKFANFRSYVLSVETARLAAANPNAPASALTGANAALLTPFANGLFSNPTRLLASIISRYNGPKVFPYISNLQWDAGNGVYAAGAGDVVQPSGTDTYAGQFVMRPYLALLTSFQPPDNNGAIATVADWVSFLGGLHLPAYNP